MFVTWFICVTALFFPSHSYVIERCQANPLPGEDVDFLNDNVTLMEYQLFTRNNPTEKQVLKLDDVEAFKKSHYNPQHPTKVFAVGWHNDGSKAHPARDEYLSREECNFIVVYWKPLQDGDEVTSTSLPAMILAGHHTGRFIDFMVKNGAPLKSFHLMGHSIGAHLVGVAAAAVTSGNIPRVTGLDPSVLLTTNLDIESIRLDRNDAEFVDIIHTNTIKVGEFGAGYSLALGHADFYVNGGHHQPGCDTPETSCCSHCRALDLFAESIRSTVGFEALRCDSYEDYETGYCSGNDSELMGDPVTITTRGIFYVDTNEEAPWAKG